MRFKWKWPIDEQWTFLFSPGEWKTTLFEIRIVILFKLGLRVEYYIVLFTAFLLWKIIFSSSSSSSFSFFFFSKRWIKHLDRREEVWWIIQLFDRSEIVYLWEWNWRDLIIDNKLNWKSSIFSSKGANSSIFENTCRIDPRTFPFPTRSMIEKGETAYRKKKIKSLSYHKSQSLSHTINRLV